MVIAHLKSTDGTAAFSRPPFWRINYIGQLGMNQWETETPPHSGTSRLYNSDSGSRIYTSSGFALGRVYSITPHPHCITYTYTTIDHIYIMHADTPERYVGGLVQQPSLVIEPLYFV